MTAVSWAKESARGMRKTRRPWRPKHTTKVSIFSRLVVTKRLKVKADATEEIIRLRLAANGNLIR